MLKNLFVHLSIVVSLLSPKVQAADGKGIAAGCIFAIVCITVAGIAIEGCGKPHERQLTNQEINVRKAEGLIEQGKQRQGDAKNIETQLSEKEFKEILDRLFKESKTMEEYLISMAKESHASSDLEKAWLEVFQRLCKEERVNPAKYKPTKQKKAEALFRHLMELAVLEPLEKGNKDLAKERTIRSTQLRVFRPLSFLLGQDLFYEVNKMLLDNEEDKSNRVVDALQWKAKKAWHTRQAIGILKEK